MAAGIYKVECTATGDFYIGASTQVSVRLRDHRKSLRRRAHHNKRMQELFDKHGERAFSYAPLIICAPEHLSLFEPRAIEVLAPTINTTRPIFTAFRHDDATKERLRENGRRMWKDAEFRKKVAGNLDELDTKRLAAKFDRFVDSLSRVSTERTITYDGETRTVAEWAARAGITKSTLRERLRKWPDDLSRCLSPRTAAEQPKTYTAHGKTQTLAAWSEELGVSENTLYARVHTRKTPLERALVSGYIPRDYKKSPETVRRMSRHIEFNGETKTLTEWAAHAGISKAALAARLHQGWSLERALTAPLVRGRLPATFTFRGEEKTVDEIAEALGTTTSFVRRRMDEGVLPDDIVVIRKCRHVTYNGVTMTVSDWAKFLSMPRAKLVYALEVNADDAAVMAQLHAETEKTRARVARAREVNARKKAALERLRAARGGSATSPS